MILSCWKMTALLRSITWCVLSLHLLISYAKADTMHWEKPPSIPDVNVLNQNGEKVRFYTDLVKGKTVVINFIFTSCKNECPTITAVLHNAQLALAGELGQDTKFISISIDPVNDRPKELKQYAEKFETGPDWTFVTGTKSDIDKLVKSLNAYNGNKIDHQPVILIGNENLGIWTRSYGIPTLKVLTTIINEAASKHSSNAHQLAPAGILLAHHVADGGPNANKSDAATSQQTAMTITDAAKYFTNLPLLTQDGTNVRFYDDLIQGKVVLINTMFTHCTAICSPMTQNLSKVQGYLGANWASNVRMISITVDPDFDSPQILKDYANSFHASPQWTFVTGKKENIDWVLYKLGAYTEKKDEHYSLLIIGNETTGEWKKVFALAKPEEIALVLKEVATPLKN